MTWILFLILYPDKEVQLGDGCGAAALSRQSCELGFAVPTQYQEVGQEQGGHQGHWEVGNVLFHLSGFEWEGK